MKQALVTLNFVVISVLVTIVAMQHRADAVLPPSPTVGNPIPGLTTSEIPVDRYFSFFYNVANMTQGFALSPWINAGTGGALNVVEFSLPANVALFLTRVQPYRSGIGVPVPNFAVYINGVIAFCGPEQYLVGGPSINSSMEPFFAPPGSTIRVEVESGLSGFNMQGTYVSATELSLP